MARNKERDVAQFLFSCLTFQKLKIEHQKPSGLMQQLDIPERKWDNILMDFVTGLPNTHRGFDAIWVIVDRPTKLAHFISVKIKFSLQKLAEIYILGIVNLHCIPLSIVSNRDLRFMSKFWESLKEALCTKLSLSSAYHLLTDG